MTASVRGLSRLVAWLRYCVAFGEAPSAAPVVWPTGFAPLDQALGGGLPGGRLTLVQGAGGCGKTSFCMRLVAQLQQGAQGTVWCDTTHTFLARRARAHGVDDSLWLVQESDLARALALGTYAVARGLARVLVLDAWPPPPTPKAQQSALGALGQAAAAQGALVILVQDTGDGSKYDAAARYACATVLKLMPEACLPCSKTRMVHISMQKTPVRNRGENVPMRSLSVPFCWHAGPQKPL